MKETVWYHAGYNELWVKTSRNRIERGSQGSIEFIDYNGKLCTVPDGLSLFTWKVDNQGWKAHLKKGWLVKLGELRQTESIPK
jgi:hypothetical protein